MRVLHTEPAAYDRATRELLERAGSVDYVDSEGRSEVIETLQRGEYEALFVRIGMSVDRALLDAAPKLRFVVTPTTGVDHLDLAELERRGIRLISLRGETAFLEQVSATAELAWGLLLALVRRIPAAHQDVLAGRWRRETWVGEDLAGKTLGVLGVGRLGRKVARYGVAFGMKVAGHDRDPAAFDGAPAGIERVALTALLERSDVLSVHLPLNAETRGFLSRERLQAMKPGAVVINTARGELLDEAALLESLRSGHLAGAALDVLAGDASWDRGTAPDAHPLVAYAKEHPNLLITPHVGGYARGAIHDTRRFVTERFLALMGPS